MCICHLQHLLEKSPGNMGPLLTKITSLTTDILHQRGHWEQSLVGGFKKNPGRQNSLFPPSLQSPSPVNLGRMRKNVKMLRPRANLKVHLIGPCAPPSLPTPSPSQAALLLWSCSEGRSYYRHRAQVRMASRQHTIKA